MASQSIVKLVLKVLMVSFLLSGHTYAYHPTLESLLNNGGNIEIGMNSVVANLIIEERNVENSLVLKSEMNLNQKHAIKLHIFNENELKPLLARVHYQGGVMTKSSLVKFDESSLWDMKTLFKDEENFDAKVFYGVMTYLLNNQGKPLLETLKKITPALKTNEQLADNEKITLLTNYKNYLVEKKDNKDLELENPLAPTATDVKDKVKEVMKRSFFMKDIEVKRIKNGKDFYWIVENDNLYMKFDKIHHLREMKVKTNMGQLEFIFGKFVIWGAQMEFPEFILFKTAEQKWYEIKPAKISMFSDNQDQYNKRLETYSKHAEQNKITESLIRPKFML